jgi:hypothetical protein
MCSTDLSLGLQCLISSLKMTKISCIKKTNIYIYIYKYKKMLLSIFIFILGIFYFIEGIIVIFGWEGAHCNPLKEY